MGHHEPDLSNLTKEEQLYYEYMNRGDDFFKIEIFRAAKNWYAKAFETGVKPETAKQKISECDRLLAYERKVFTILGIAATIIILISIAVF